MTTEANAAPAVAAALANQGATADNLNDGQTLEGAPKAPAAPSNEPPKKVAKPEGINEENGVVADPAKTAADKAAKEASDKVAADKAVEDKKEADGPLKAYTDFTDSPAASAAVNLLKEAGIGPNAANEFFAKAIASGDLKDIDVKGLEAKLGKDKTTLVIAGVTAHYSQQTAKSQATVQAVHEIFGGAQNWGVVRDWAQAAEKADPSLKASLNDIRAMFDEGGTRAALAGRELLRMYNAAPQTKGLGTNKLAVGDATGNVVGTHLSRADYVTELKAAHAKGASRVEIQALDARRKAGKAAGI